MADLKLLTERVVEKEKAALRQNIERAQAEAEDDVQASQAAEVSKRQQLKDEVKARAEREYEIKKNTLEIQKRNQILSAKQNLLSKVFVDAKEKFNTLDRKTFQAFLLNVLQQFTNDVTVTFGEYSKDLIPTQSLERNDPDELSVHISDETVPGKSGFIVAQGGVDYNFLFDELIEDMKNDILSDISKELF